MFDKGVCAGYQLLSVGVTSTGFTIPTAAVEAALIRTNSGTVRMRFDGTNPTTGTGYPIFGTDTQGFWIYGAGCLKNAQLISVSGTNMVDILYFTLRE